MCVKTPPASDPIARTCSKCQKWRSAGAFVDWLGKRVRKNCSICREVESIRSHWRGSGELVDHEKLVCRQLELEKVEGWVKHLEERSMTIDQRELADLHPIVKTLIVRFENPAATGAPTTNNKSIGTLDNGISEQSTAAKVLEAMQLQGLQQKHKQSSDDTTIEIPQKRKRQPSARYIAYDKQSAIFLRDDQIAPESHVRFTPPQIAASTETSRAPIESKTTPPEQFLQPAAHLENITSNARSTLQTRVKGLFEALEHAADVLPQQQYAEIEARIEQALSDDFETVRKLIKDEIVACQAVIAAREGVEAARQAWSSYKKA